MTTTTPQVWIGCLAAYNEGTLHGKWVDAVDADVMQEALAEVIKTSPADFPEEWFIADYDGFGSVSHQLGEYANFETVASVGQMIDEYGEEFLAYLSVQDDALEAVASFGEARQGAWGSEEDFAYDWYEGTGSLDPDAWYANYVDWARVAREMFRHGPYSYVDGYVFRSDV